MPDPNDPPLYVHDVLAGAAWFPSSSLPNARIDAVDLDAALAIIAHQAPPPDRHHTLLLLLDHERRGFGITHVENTVDPEAVIHIMELVAGHAALNPDLGGVIVVSFRPGGSDQLDDVERWLTMDEELGAVGVELVEWFVIGGAVSRPRTLVGEPSRWAA
ncbi:MAG: hypothetical protein AB8G26_19505 [Ilumatobacter sp.]